VLAFDFGERRLGVAVGDLAVGIAHPLITIDAADARSRFEQIGRLVSEWRPVLLVVGLPAHGDGTEHELSRLARRFARRLEGRFGINVTLVDERLTSRMAESGLRRQGLSTNRIEAVLDAAAAREILEAFLEERHRPPPG